MTTFRETMTNVIEDCLEQYNWGDIGSIDFTTNVLEEFTKLIDSKIQEYEKMPSYVYVFQKLKEELNKK